MTAADDEPAPVALLALLRVDDPTPPPGLTDRVVRAVRSRVAADDGWVRLAEGVRVRTRVITAVARLAAEGHGGVSVVGAVLSADGVVVLRLVVDGREPLPELARAVRRRVRSALRTCGLTDVVVRIDLAAVDLL